MSLSRKQTAWLYEIPIERLETDRHRRWRHLTETVLMVIYVPAICFAVLSLVSGGGWASAIMLVASFLGLCSAFFGLATRYKLVAIP
jgi:hypothetical protein